MHLWKFITLASVSLLLPAAAASYQVNGTISSSEIGTLPVSTNFTITFDYDPLTVGGDSNDSSDVGYYTTGVSNIAILFNSVRYGVSPSGFIVTNQPASTGSGDSFAPRFGGLNYPAGGLTFQNGEFRFYGGENRWTSDAAPTDLMVSPWSSGRLQLTFTGEDEFGFEEQYRATGSLDMGSLQIVPEPTSALLLGLAGGVAVLRRRR